MELAGWLVMTWSSTKSLAVVITTNSRRYHRFIRPPITSQPAAILDLSSWVLPYIRGELAKVE